MLAARAEQAATGPSTSAPSSANLASSLPPLGTSAPVTPSGSPHSSLTSQQAQHLSSQVDPKLCSSAHTKQVFSLLVLVPA